MYKYRWCYLRCPVEPVWELLKRWKSTPSDRQSVAIEMTSFTCESIAIICSFLVYWWTCTLFYPGTKNEEMVEMNGIIFLVICCFVCEWGIDQCGSVAMRCGIQNRGLMIIMTGIYEDGDTFHAILRIPYVSAIHWTIMSAPFLRRSTHFWSTQLIRTNERMLTFLFVHSSVVHVPTSITGSTFQIKSNSISWIFFFFFKLDKFSRLSPSTSAFPFPLDRHAARAGACWKKKLPKSILKPISTCVRVDVIEFPCGNEYLVDEKSKYSHRPPKKDWHIKSTPVQNDIIKTNISFLNKTLNTSFIFHEYLIIFIHNLINIHRSFEIVAKWQGKWRWQRSTEMKSI